MKLFKIIGSILVLGSTVAFGFSLKSSMYLRVKALEQLILASEICEREIKFNFIKIPNLISKLSKEIQNPVGRVFKEINKIVEMNDGLSVEYKWAKTFKEYGEFLSLNKEDLDVVINMSNALGKYDIDEQIKSTIYYKNRLNLQLLDAKNRLKNEGNITNTLAISIGLALVIILI